MPSPFATVAVNLIAAAGPEAGRAPWIGPAAGPLAVQIRGRVYGVRLVAPACGGPGAYEVSPLDSPDERYRVSVSPRGEVRCDCPDFRIRRAGTGLRCKHGACLVDLGLVAAPAEEGGRS